MDLQIISTLAGLFSLGFTVIAVIVGAVILGKNTARQTTADAQKNAIDAMQAEIDTLRGRTDDLKKENTRLELIIETICSALKTRGMIITVQGEMINIQDSGSSTTTKIQGTLHTTNP